uniref:Uncharacterized protein n=1 Tax=Sphaerodactylus townsendi TaxID=933632 RepID=A0ACB8G3G5_9SAUR
MDFILPETSLNCKAQDWMSVVGGSDGASDADEVEYWDSLNDFTRGEQIWVSMKSMAKNQQLKDVLKVGKEEVELSEGG